MNIKKIICKGCGVELMFTPQTVASRCNFCSQSLVGAEIKDDNVAEPDLMVPFKITRDKYMSEALSYLAEGDHTPEEILNDSIFDSIVGVYVPVWQYAASYEGSWRASSGYKYDEEYLERNEDGEMVVKKKTLTRYETSRGNCSGEVSVMVPAGLKSGIHEDLGDEVDYLDIEDVDLKPFDMELASGLFLLDFKKTEKAAWNSEGKEKADSEVKYSVNPPGDTHDDLETEVDYNTVIAKRVYLPFWVAHYNYEGKPYFVYMIALDDKSVSGSRPTDKTSKSNIKTTRRIIWWAGLAIIWLISFLVDQQDDGWDFWFTFFVGIIGLLIFRSILTKSIISTAKSRRQEILSGIQKRKNS